MFQSSSSSDLKTDNKTQAKELVDKSIHAYPIVLFSKTYCPFSKKAKDALNKAKIPYKVFELDVSRPLGQSRVSEGEIRFALRDLSGIGTVPQLFANGTFVGDSDGIVSKYSS